MKKKLFILAVVGLMVCLIGSVAIAGGPSGPAGKSNIAHLYLYEKDPSTWQIIEGGAWGKMKYNLEGVAFNFVFNGHRLDPDEDYTLIYYPDPWPGNFLICLGSGIADRGGNVHIEGSVPGTCDLPARFDNNYPAGAKIWLVLSDDVKCEGDGGPPKMTGWHPTEYLFEYKLMTYTDLLCPF